MQWLIHKQSRISIYIYLYIYTYICTILYLYINSGPKLSNARLENRTGEGLPKVLRRSRA